MESQTLLRAQFVRVRPTEPIDFSVVDRMRFTYEYQTETLPSATEPGSGRDSALFAVFRVTPNDSFRLLLA